MSRVRANAWWVVPPIVIAVVLGFTVGYPIAWLAYVVFNVAGVWLYCDRHGSQRAKRQRWLRVATILMLPAGVLGLFGSGGSGQRPSTSTTFGSDDPDVRTAAVQRAFGNGDIGHP